MRVILRITPHISDAYPLTGGKPTLYETKVVSPTSNKALLLPGRLQYGRDKGPLIRDGVAHLESFGFTVDAVDELSVKAALALKTKGKTTVFVAVPQGDPFGPGDDSWTGTR